MVAVEQARREALRPLAAMLARAFAEDPVANAVVGGRAGRDARLERFFAVQLGATYFGRGYALVAGDGAAAALCLPPGAPPPTLRERLAAYRLVPTLGRGLPLAAALSRRLALGRPSVPHLYLATLGTEPARQGQGLGSALLAELARRADGAGVPAYLEASTERNVALYARFGFAVREAVDLGPPFPTIWLMERPARGPS